MPARPPCGKISARKLRYGLFGLLGLAGVALAAYGAARGSVLIVLSALAWAVYALAQKQIEIYTDSLTLAEQQKSEIQERINIGNLAEIELAAAQAEVALRKESLINARSNLAKERLNLLRLLNPYRNIDWDANVILKYDTNLPDAALDNVEQHIQLALKMRPELNQAKLQIKRGDYF